VDFRFLFLCFSHKQAERPRGGCCCWAGFGLLFWSFAIEKTEEKNVAKEGASVLLGMWALEERLEKGSLSGVGDGGAAAADFYG